MSLPFDRFTFYCCAEDCHEIIVIPAEGGDDARRFLLEETPWTAREELDYMHLRCPRHSSDEEEEKEGSESLATDERHVCEWSMPSSTARGAVRLPYTCWCKEDATDRMWARITQGLIQVSHCPHCGAPASNCEPPEEPRDRTEEREYVVDPGAHLQATDHPFALTGLLDNRADRVEMGLVDRGYETVEQLCKGLESNRINKNTFSGAGAGTISNLRELAEEFRKSNG